MELNQRVTMKIVENGVNNIKEFGYPSVDEKNIFTDFIYAQMFLKMLNENLGLGFDDEINHLIEQVNIDDLS